LRRVFFRFGRFRVPGCRLPGDLHGEVLEFGDQGAEFLRVVEQGLVFGELVRGEVPGGGLAADLAGSFSVGPCKRGGSAWQRQRQSGLP
jgi:hypothetical protein